MIAIQNNDIEMVTMLLDEGADVQGRYYDDNPLFTACYMGHHKIVELLIAREADIHYRTDYGTPLNAAARGKSVAIAQMLLTLGVKVDPVGHYGATPLITACENGDRELVSLLVSKGANVNARTEWISYGTVSPLTLARKHGFKEIAEVLIAAGAK